MAFTREISGLENLECLSTVPYNTSDMKFSLHFKVYRASATASAFPAVGRASPSSPQLLSFVPQWRSSKPNLNASLESAKGLTTASSVTKASSC
ncbi:hypothetical protein SUGI_0600700 [Cryptomeria japonica]|nr:hypothetical protein SUGI_0600700 [Cryptomeria japonica]